MANEAPYKILKRGGKYVVVNNTGAVKATFKTEPEALKYQRALYANVPGAARKATRTPWTGKAKAPERANTLYGEALARIEERAQGPDPMGHEFAAGPDGKCKHCGMDKAAHNMAGNARSAQAADRAQVLEVADQHGGRRTLLLGKLHVGELAELAEAYEKAAADNPYHLTLAGRFVQAEQANANGAYWSTADLRFGQPSINNGPLNWLHEPHRIIGSLIDSKLIAPGLEVAGGGPTPVGSHLAVAAVLWKHLYPSLADLVEAASAAGTLHYSMECTSEKVECSTGDGRTGCGQSFPYRQIAMEPASVCEHLRERSSQRWFHDPTFLGGALIVPPLKPAWSDASARVLKPVLDEAANEAARSWPQAEAAGFTQQAWAELVTAAAIA